MILSSAFQLESLVLDNNKLTTVVLEVADIDNIVNIFHNHRLLIQSFAATEPQTAIPFSSWKPTPLRLQGFVINIINTNPCPPSAIIFLTQGLPSLKLTFFQSLWLRRVLESKTLSVLLPPCFSPFSRNTLTLRSFEGMLSLPVYINHRCAQLFTSGRSFSVADQVYLPGTSLCSLSDETRIPKFFRVTEQVFDHIF